MKNLMNFKICSQIILGILCLSSCGEFCTDGVVTLRFTNSGEKNIDIESIFPYAVQFFNTSVLSNISPRGTAQHGVDREQWTRSIGSASVNLTVRDHSLGNSLTSFFLDISDDNSDIREVNITY